MLKSELTTQYSHLNSNASSISSDYRHKISTPTNYSMNSKNMIKVANNRINYKSNVKKILYSNIMSTFKEDIKIVPNKTRSQERMTERNKGINKIVFNKSKSVRQSDKQQTTKLVKNNLNTTRDSNKECSFISSKLNSPGYSRGRNQVITMLKPIQKKTLSNVSNVSRDTSKKFGDRSTSKSRYLNDITVSDNDKTITDRTWQRTPKPPNNIGLKNSKTPKIKKTIPVKNSKLNDKESSKSIIQRQTEKMRKILKNEDSYLHKNVAKMNNNSALYSICLKNFNPKKLKGNLFNNIDTKKTMKQKGIIQNKTFDSSIIANQCKDEKFELEKSAIITDEMKEKERNDRNMNSLINVENRKKEDLTKNYNFIENTTSPIVRRKDNDVAVKKLVKIPVKAESTKLITETNDEIKKVSKKIKNICDLTKMGYSSSGSKKVNQDNFFIKSNFLNETDYYLGVCDGHGQLGHLVSGFVKENLPVSLEKCIKRRYKVTSHNSNNNNLHKIIEDVFLDINSKLCNQQPFDTNFSGSTCCTVIYNPEKLTCANVGDSRAVLGRLIDNEWKHIDLSRDHKPDDREENKRIISKGGRVEPFRDESGMFLGPSRVWLFHDDVPGLAMSRSFADQVAASVGVIAIPEITEWNLTSEDKFFIIASDGVWEFIESSECVGIIKDYYLKNDIYGAAEFLMKESTTRWMKDDESVDDITLIIVFFE